MVVHKEAVPPGYRAASSNSSFSTATLNNSLIPYPPPTIIKTGEKKIIYSSCPLLQHTFRQQALPGRDSPMNNTLCRTTDTSIWDLDAQTGA